MTDREEQDDELLALSEILDSSNFKHSVSEENGLNTGEMIVHVSIDGDTGVAIQTGDEDQDQFHVHHLPPVTLQFTLPAQYPSQCQPSLSLSCPWLHHNHIEKLHHHLNELYEEQGGGVILFSWLSFLQEEMLTFLDMESVINVSDICEDHDNVGCYDTITASDVRDGLTVIDDDDNCQASGSSKSDEPTHKNAEKTEKQKYEDISEKKIEAVLKENKDRSYEEIRNGELNHKVKIGIVKKYKQIDETYGHGFIREVKSGREWSFQFKDCINNEDYRGFVLFKKGDKVTFEEKIQRGNFKNNHKQTTPKAFNVAFYDEEDVKHNEIVNDFNKIQLNGDKTFEDNEESKVKAVPDIETEVKNHPQEETVIDNCKTTFPSKTENKVQKQETKKKSRKQILITLLREFNQMKEEELFSVSLYSCEICYIDKVGSQCVRFVGCNHVYCRDCMSQYLTVRIRDGAVSNLNCPTDKCTSQILPTQVSKLVPSDLYQRYETILLETQLESMVDVVICPRLACQCPTMIDRETNMGQCPSCQLAFCIYCRQTYHGVTPCKMKSVEQRAILDKYVGSSAEEKAFLERKYGKKQLENMANDLASADYVKDKTQHCPHCNAPIEKNDGCNKITCWRCSTNFCWLCGVKLNAQNPYSHFNVVGGNCFGALFQGVDPGFDDEFGDDFGDEDGWEPLFI